MKHSGQVAASDGNLRATTRETNRLLSYYEARPRIISYYFVSHLNTSTVLGNYAFINLTLSPKSVFVELRFRCDQVRIPGFIARSTIKPRLVQRESGPYLRVQEFSIQPRDST